MMHSSCVCFFDLDCPYTIVKLPQPAEAIQPPIPSENTDIYPKKNNGLRVNAELG
jgi:hypothetical protein